MAENHIPVIQHLETMRNLVTLNLSTNKISKIENLNLPNLRELDLSYNKIVEITNLKSLKKFTTLNLSYNAIGNPSLINGKAYVMMELK